MSGSAPDSVPMITRAGVQIGARLSDDRAFGQQGGILLLVDELDIHLLVKDKYQRMLKGELHDKNTYNFDWAISVPLDLTDGDRTFTMI
jgi:hypothetical protein